MLSRTIFQRLDSSDIDQIKIFQRLNPYEIYLNFELFSRFIDITGNREYRSATIGDYKINWFNFNMTNSKRDGFFLLLGLVSGPFSLKLGWKMTL